MNAAALVASALALQPVPAVEELDRFYACDASAEAGGGSVAVSSRLDEAGRFSGGEGVGTYRQAGTAVVSIHWNFYVFDQNPFRSDVTIDVPLSGRLRSGQVMRLIKEKSSPYEMALTAPAERSAYFSPGAHVSAELETLLAYAGNQPQLGWIVETRRSEKVSGTGYLDVAPMRAMAAAFPGLLAELKAKQVNYRTQCTYREEPYNTDAEI